MQVLVHNVKHRPC